MELSEGRPLDTEGRLEKEVRVYDLLDQLGITYWRTDHEAAGTMEDCNEIDRILDVLDLQKSVFVQSPEDKVLYVDDARGQTIQNKRIIGTDPQRQTFFCTGRIYGGVSGYHSGFRKYYGIDERYRQSGTAVSG